MSAEDEALNLAAEVNRLVMQERAMGGLMLTSEAINLAVRGATTALEANADLLPELKSIIESLAEAGETVIRALKFMEASNDVASEKMGEEVDDAT